MQPSAAHGSMAAVYYIIIHIYWLRHGRVGFMAIYRPKALVLTRLKHYIHTYISVQISICPRDGRGEWMYTCKHHEHTTNVA